MERQSDMKQKDNVDVESLEKEVAVNQEKIRQLKRANSEYDLMEAVELIHSEKKSDQKKLLDACYNYIAQHRALFKKGGFNQSGEWIE